MTKEEHNIKIVKIPELGVYTLQGKCYGNRLNLEDYGSNYHHPTKKQAEAEKYILTKRTNELYSFHQFQNIK